MQFDKTAVTGMADFLESLDREQFNMRFISSETADCRTVACIAGWTIARLGNSQDAYNPNTGFRSDFDLAAELLGMDSDDAMRLFAIPDHEWEEPTTATQAARVLRHLAATGEIDWSARRQA